MERQRNVKWPTAWLVYLHHLKFVLFTSGVMKAEPVSSCEKLATSTLETEEYVASKEHAEVKARV